MIVPRISDVQIVSRQLAGDSARILDWVQGLPSRIDPLLAAALDRNWREVDRLSEQLVAQPMAGCERLCEQAAALRRELAKPDNGPAVTRSLVRLIFECGRVDPRNVTLHRPQSVAARRSNDATRA